MGIQRYHAELTKIDSSGNQYMIYPKTTVTDVYTDSKSGINIEGKLNFFGMCTTDGGTAAKTVTIPGFVLKTGSRLDIMLMYKPTTSSIISLRVNNYASYEIYYKGANINPDILYDKVVISLVFFNNRFEVVGIDSVMSVSELTSSNIYLTATSGTGVQRELHMNKNVYIQGGTGKIVASGFIGDGSTLTKLNASNIGSGTLSVNRLSDSGVEAKTYGPTGDSNVAIGNSITVPSFTVDAKGRITSAASRSISLALDKTYLPLSGGTLTGNLVVKPSTGSGTIQLCYNGNTAGEISTVSNGLSIYPIYTNCGYVGTYNQQFKAMYATTFYGTLSGNATTATKLASSRTLTIGNTGKAFNGSSDVSWSLSEIGAAASSHTHDYLPLTGGTLSGGLSVGDIVVTGSIFPSGSLTHDLGSEYKGWGKVYAESFIGTLYGNARVASYLETPRTFIIGNTGKQFNGGSDVSWSLSEIGAAASSHTHNYAGSSSAGGHATYADNLISPSTSSGALLGRTGSYISLFGDFNQQISIRGNGTAAGHTTGVFLCTYDDNTAMFTPYTDNAVSCASPYQRWAQVYAASPTISTSDKNLKDNISLLSLKYKELFLKLIPVSFTFKDGSSGRTHVGFIAQDVEVAMEELGMSPLEFAGFCKDVVKEATMDCDGNRVETPVYNDDGSLKYIYSLRYEEFIGIVAGVVQDLYADMKKLERDVIELQELVLK